MENSVRWEIMFFLIYLIQGGLGFKWNIALKYSYRMQISDEYWKGKISTFIFAWELVMSHDDIPMITFSLSFTICMALRNVIIHSRTWIGSGISHSRYADVHNNSPYRMYVGILINIYTVEFCATLRVYDSFSVRELRFKRFVFSILWMAVIKVSL